VQGCSSALLDKVEHKHKGQEKTKENKINAGWKSRLNNEKKTKQRKLKQKESKIRGIKTAEDLFQELFKKGNRQTSCYEPLAIKRINQDDVMNL
jgi:hypothetical protein